MLSITVSQPDHAPNPCGCTEDDACGLGPAIEQMAGSEALSGTAYAKSQVLAVAPAPSSAALAHFSQKLEFETDCSDVHHAFASGTVDFVLLDVRGAQLYQKGHVPGAVNVPVRTISEERMKEFPISANFVVYCAGPHCNGANKAAIRLSELGRPVKEMIGGVTGWLDEGLTLEQ